MRHLGGKHASDRVERPREDPSLTRKFSETFSAFSATTPHAGATQRERAFASLASLAVKVLPEEQSLLTQSREARDCSGNLS